MYADETITLGLTFKRECRIGQLFLGGVLVSVRKTYLPIGLIPKIFILRNPLKKPSNDIETLAECKCYR